jgi:ABC-type branched-subunit amino acid transport system ATPase component
MLEVTGLCAGYGDTQILHGVDISAAAGKVVAYHTDLGEYCF